MLGILGWIVFGLIVGAIAKLVMPGKDPGGIIVTMAIGIAGALVAGFIWRALGWYQSDEAAGFIGQQSRYVHVERQQMADGVPVLRAIQSVDDIAAGRGASRPGAVQGTRQPRGEGRVLRLCRVRRSLRRHRADAQLPEDTFPRCRVRQ